MKDKIVIIPLKNDFNSFLDFMNELDGYQFMFTDTAFLIIDDSNSTIFLDIDERIIKRKNDIKMMHLIGMGNYGDSIKQGFRLGKKYYKKIVLMDIDHPLTLIPDMFKMLDYTDMVIGNDKNGNKERLVTKTLISIILGFSLNHPTCGFMGFNSNTLIDFEKCISKKDIIHVEFILMYIKKKMNFSTIDFDTSNTDIKHNYNFKRYIVWISDLLMVSYMDIFYNNYE